MGEVEKGEEIDIVDEDRVREWDSETESLWEEWSVDGWYGDYDVVHVLLKGDSGAREVTANRNELRALLGKRKRYRFLSGNLYWVERNGSRSRLHSYQFTRASLIPFQL